MKCMPNCPFVKYGHYFYCASYKAVLAVEADSQGISHPVRVSHCAHNHLKVVWGRKRAITLDGEMPKDAESQSVEGGN